MSTRLKALNAYRHGLRATRIAFQNDTEVLSAARAKMRSGMVNPPNPKLTEEEQIKHLEDVAVFLKRNLVQGKKVNDGNKKEPRYHLNIHKDTELGDNETTADPTARVKTNLKARPFKCSDKKQ
ncbi:fmp36p [Saccharomyces arboricola H-6]|uniref:Mitochondrial zinc maintenance protein 1, mitochondrial n=1 Tax=Saccharomyces arboricola (strain H-6 / AS 2.3317 / CBS 10644) TaxID=1160507 RepID=J8LJG7_SACAR|nr:fmp36p [Saccharomyces arboricola H-6]